MAQPALRSDGPDDFGPPPPPPRSEPVFNLPRVVLLALGVLAVVFAVQSLVPPAWEETIVVTFGFSPVRYDVAFEHQSGEWLWTPLTYSLLHGSIAHLGFNALWLAAFGTPVARRIGAARFLAFWVFSSAAGAALHAAVNWGQPTLMVGASAVVSGLMGAACRFAFGRRGRSGLSDSDAAIYAPRLSVLQALRERTVLVFTAAWLFGNVVIAFGIPLFGDMSAAVAWDAHIGGFLSGFLFFALFDRRAKGGEVV